MRKRSRSPATRSPVQSRAVGIAEHTALTPLEEPRTPSYRTPHITLQTTPLKSCRLVSIWKTSLVIPIPKHCKDSSQATSYRPISLLCPAAKVPEALILPSINEFLSPAHDQYGFRPEHSITSARLQGMPSRYSEPGMATVWAVDCSYVNTTQEATL